MGMVKVCMQGLHEYDNAQFKRCPECKRARENDYYAQNLELMRERGRTGTKRRYAANLEVSRAKGRKIYHANADKYRKQRKDRYHANPAGERDRKRKFKYDLTPEQWEAMFDSQGRRCANEQCLEDNPKSKNPWHTDHDHVTGQVRGILCLHCNVSLGYAKESQARLIGLFFYLDKHKVTCV